MNSPASIIDRACRLTGLTLASLAERLGIREATLYKAHRGLIPLSAKTARSIELLLSGLPAPSPTHALRSAKAKTKTPARSIPLATLTERLVFLHAHATEDELQILAATLDAFHRQVASRQQS